MSKPLRYGQGPDLRGSPSGASGGILHSLAIRITILAVCLTVVMSFLLLAFEAAVRAKGEHDALEARMMEIARSVQTASTFVLFNVDKKLGAALTQDLVTAHGLARAALMSDREAVVAASTRSGAEPVWQRLGGWLIGDAPVVRLSMETEVDGGSVVNRRPISGHHRRAIVYHT